MISKQLQEALATIDKVWPYKRVKAPKHLLDRFNEGKKEKLLEFAITVQRDVKVTDDMLWDSLLKCIAISKTEAPINFEDGSWDHSKTDIGTKD